MGHKVTLVGMMLVCMAGSALAVQTASSPAITASNPGWVSGPSRATVALLETTTTALGGVLSSLGVGYDDYQGPPFTGVPLGGYTDVILGMDGGTVEQSDVQYLATWAQGGGHLHFFGGTCWADYVDGMNTYLVQNNTSNYCWTMDGGKPDVTVVDANNCLAKGLAATYTFSNPSASYYEFRATDPGIAVAANNGDGYNLLFSKVIGSGVFDYCINSSYVSYWAGQDLAWMTTVVDNFLHCSAPVPVQSTSWGNIKNTFK